MNDFSGLRAFLRNNKKTLSIAVLVVGFCAFNLYRYQGFVNEVRMQRDAFFLDRLMTLVDEHRKEASELEAQLKDAVSPEKADEIRRKIDYAKEELGREVWRLRDEYGPLK